MYSSFKPYLLQAFYDWCTDNQLNPLIDVVGGNKNNILPSQFNSESKIIMTLSPDAINDLIMKEDGLEFKAKFNSIESLVFIHYDNIEKIFSKETGYGLEFSSFKIGNDFLSKNNTFFDIVKK